MGARCPSVEPWAGVQVRTEPRRRPFIRQGQLCPTSTTTEGEPCGFGERRRSQWPRHRNGLLRGQSRNARPRRQAGGDAPDRAAGRSFTDTVIGDIPTAPNNSRRSRRVRETRAPHSGKDRRERTHTTELTGGRLHSDPRVRGERLPTALAGHATFAPGTGGRRVGWPGRAWWRSRCRGRFWLAGT